MPIKGGVGVIFGVEWYMVLLAVLVYFGVGALWYSPVLFAKQWLKELGKNKPDMGNATSAMATTFIAMVVLVVVEAYFIKATGTSGAWRGAYLGAKLWLGFAAMTALINNVFQGTSKKLYAIDQGYHLVGIVLAGLIMTL